MRRGLPYTAAALTLWLWGCSFGPAAAQQTGLAAAAWTGAGLDGHLDALGREVTGVPVMTGAELSYHLALPADFSGGLGLGGMYVRREGSLGEERFTAEAWRFTVAPELGYRATEQLRFRAGVEIRSAADLAAFDTRFEDNVRTHLRLAGDVRLNGCLAVTAAVSRLLGDTGDIGNLVDPGRSIRLGLRHRFARDTDRN